MESILKYVRPNIRNLMPYSSARSERSGQEESARETIKLDANESPWSGNGFAEEHCENRYPDPQPRVCLEKMAQHYGVKPDQVLLTRGIDESLDLIFRTFCEPQRDSIIIHPPTYGYYEVLANIQSCRTIKADLRPDFSLDQASIIDRINETVKIVVICNPNNPTGKVMKRGEIESLAAALEGRCLLLLDEAYVEYSEQESFVPLLEDSPHVLIMRTFSKAWGLAGARLGVTLAHPRLIEVLKKVMAPYPISRSSLRILKAALESEQVRMTRLRVQQTIALRDELQQALSRIRGVVRVHASDTNFLLIELDNPERWVSKLLDRGICIRDRSSEVPRCVRITVGSREENDQLLSAMEDIAG